MTRQPLVSVIVPIYNVEQFLRRCIDSLQSQTHSSLEIILVDDGSRDGCDIICDEYALCDPRILVVHQENAGLSEARNAGLVEARGEYCLFVDADDWCEAEMVEAMVSAAGTLGADCVVCGYVIDYRDESYGIAKRAPFDQVYRGQHAIPEAIFELDDAGMFNVVWNKLYRRSTLEENHIVFRDAVPGEDLLFNVEYFKSIESVAFLGRVLYHYERRESETLVSKYRPDLFERVGSFNEARRELYEYFGMASEKYSRTYARTYVANVGSCWPNLYRRGSHLSRMGRLAEIKRIVDDVEVQKHLREARPKNWSTRLFRRVFLIPSPHLILLISDALFYVRHSVPTPYRRIRRLLAK